VEILGLDSLSIEDKITMFPFVLLFMTISTIYSLLQYIYRVTILVIQETFEIFFQRWSLVLRQNASLAKSWATFMNLNIFVVFCICLFMYMYKHLKNDNYLEIFRRTLTKNNVCVRLIKRRGYAFRVFEVRTSYCVDPFSHTV